MSDAESIIYGILNENWSATYAVKPQLIYDDSTRQRTIGYPHSIKVYEVDETYTPQGLGYPSEERRHRVTVDLQGQNRTVVLAQVTEAKRCLNLRRKNPGAALATPNTDYDLLFVENAVKQSGYAGFYHYTLDCFLRRTSATIT